MGDGLTPSPPQRSESAGAPRCCSLRSRLVYETAEYEIAEYEMAEYEMAKYETAEWDG